MDETADRTDWLIGGGETGDLIRSTDWAVTPLGPRESWPISLRSVVQLVVESGFPMALLWGRDLILLYNDAYRVICADKHPRALGRSSRDIWPEVRHINEPILTAVLERGEAVHLEDKLFPIHRGGQLEDAYFTLSYSPVRDTDGGVAGALVTLLETTGAVRRYDQQSRLFDAVVSTTPDFVYVFDRQGRFLYANRRLLEVWGMELVQIIGKTCRELGYEQWHHDMHMREIAQVIETMRPIKGEVPFTAPRTGVFGVYEYIFTPVTGGDGQVELIAGTTRDVTERNRSEQALRESEAALEHERIFLRTVIDSVASMVMVRDAEGRCVLANEAAARFYGLTVPALEGLDCHDLATSAPSLAEDRDVMGSGKETISELEAVGADGQHRFLMVARTPLRNALGQFDRVLITSVDITWRRRAERALRESEDRLRLALDAADLGAFDFYPPSGHLVWSEHAKRHFGVPPTAGVTYETFLAGLHPDDRQRVQQIVSSVLRGENGGMYDTEYRTLGIDDGRERWLAARGQVFFDATDRPVRFVGITRDITDRKHMEQALRETNERLARIVDNIHDALMIDDIGGRVVYANDRFLRIFGLERRDLQGLVLEDYVAPEYRGALRERHDRRVRGESVPQHFEYEGVRRDGSRMWLEVDVVEICDTTGRVTHTQSAIRDITDRKETEQALRRNDQILRAIMEHVPIGITICDALGRFVLSSKAGRALSGRSPDLPDAAAYLTANRVFTGDGTTPVPSDDLPMLRAAKRGEVVRDAETIVERADGARITVLSSAAPIMNEDGEVTGAVLAYQDITERKRVEEAVRASEEKFAKAFHGSAAAVAISRLDDGTFIDINPTYSRITGYTRDDLVGKRPTTIWKDFSDRAAFVTALRRGGSVEAVEGHFVKKNGEEWTGLVSAQVITLGGDETIISSIVDITRRRQAEAELNEREADLREALARLAEADRRKDEFIAILSHELRNPLAPIRYALPVLQRERLSHTGERAVTVIDRQTYHLSRLVDDLLDVSRITRGKIELRREHVALAAVVSAAAEAASPVITAARHLFEIVVPDDSIWLHADAARIAQVLTNLLNNSAKYTPRGGRIMLTARQEQDEAVIEVRDNGMGIPQEALPTVFEMFRQVNRPDKSQGGLGIGLALVKRLVEMHGGTIEARSEGAGRGASFVVRLPVAKDGEVETGAGTGEHVSATGRRLRVLVVDDNADLVEMLGFIVEAAGHEVRKALDGRSAVSAALSYRPDVVLLDLGLPVMSGIEVARELRRRPETINTRLVALTGWGQAEDRRQTADAGFDEHLTKPADPKQVERLLGEFSGAAR